MLTDFMKNRFVIATIALCAGFVLAYLVLPGPDAAPADVAIDVTPGDIPEDLEHLKEPQDGVHFVVEEMPELIGGMAAVVEKMQYPETARKEGVEGRVFVQFVVSEEGSVENVVVTRGIGAGCDEEAIRVVSSLKFTPGMQDGKAVKVRLSLPVTFKLA